MFEDVVTPFTDVDDVELARTPPASWLEGHKVKARHRGSSVNPPVAMVTS